MSDPRTPERPDGDAGSNWSVCIECSGQAHHVRDIRHKKNCPSRTVNASGNLPEVWEDLKVALDAAPEGGWVACLAWAVGGGDPEHVDIRVAGGNATYTNAWCVFGPRGGERVKLRRLDGLHEVVRWMKPDDVVEVRWSEDRPKREGTCLTT